MSSNQERRMTPDEIVRQWLTNNVDRRSFPFAEVTGVQPHLAGLAALAYAAGLEAAAKVAEETFASDRSFYGAESIPAAIHKLKETQP